MVIVSVYGVANVLFKPPFKPHHWINGSATAGARPGIAHQGLTVDLPRVQITQKDTARHRRHRTPAVDSGATGLAIVDREPMVLALRSLLRTSFNS
jgi:hypothetical protein